MPNMLRSRASAIAKICQTHTEAFLGREFGTKIAGVMNKEESSIFKFSLDEDF
jgi:hypothetical protein